MNPTNLSQYYQQQGQALPSVPARAADAAKAGITGAYTGTAEQNNQLLSYYLQPKKTTPSVVSNDGMNAKVNDITAKAQTYGVPSYPQPQQVQQQPQQQAQQPTQIDYRTSPYQQDPETGVKAYYNPSTGAYDQYENTGGIVNYGGISVPAGQLTDPSLKAMLDNQLKAKQENKTDYEAQLKAITDRFVQYRQQQQQLTQSGAAQTQNALLQSGAGNRGSVAQYAAATSDARVNSIMSDGLKALQELDNAEQQLKAEAFHAYNSQNYKILDEINSSIEKVRQEQLSKTKTLNEAIASETKQSAKDLAIAQAYETFGNDPISIIKELNKQGVTDITSKDISSAIQNLTDQKGLDDLAMQISKNGYNPSIIKGAKTVSQAIDLAGEALHTPNNQVVKFGNGAYLIDKNTGKVTQSFGIPIQAAANTVKAVAGTPVVVTATGKYASDLDALIGNTVNTIPSKFGQTTFKESIAKARDDADKIGTIATVLLKNAPSEERKDFVNQTVGIKQIDKAIAMLDSGVKTGVLEAGQQYLYNQAGKDFDPKLAQLNQLIISAIQPYRNSITGAAWGDQEDAEYQQLFGSTKYSPTELKQRLQGIKEIMKDKSTGALRAYVDPLSQYSDPFSNLNTFKGIPKGSMSDRDYVEKVLTSQNLPYDKVVNDTPQGEIPVIDNATGQIGTIPIAEYNARLFTKI